MPRVVYVPNIMEPRSREILPCRVGIPVARVLPPYLDYTRCLCIHRGKAERVDLSAFKFDDEFDELIVRVVPGTGVGELIFGTTIAAAMKAGAYAVAAAIVITNLIVAVAASFAIGSLVNALTPKPKRENTGYEGEATPTYGWDGIQNTSQNGLPIQLVYGRHKIAGQYLSTFTDAVEDGKAKLSALIGLCAGEISAVNGYTSDQDGLTASTCGDNLRINNNAASSYTGIEVAYRRGAWDQTIIPGFDDVITQHDLSQQLSSSPYTYTTTADVEAVEIMCSFPAGLYRVNASGAFLQYECQISARYRENDSTAAWSAPETITFSTQTRSRWNAKHRIALPRVGKYQVEITRVTAVDDGLHTSVVFITGMKEIRFDDIAYRGIALLGVKAMASEQLNGQLPSITSIVHGRKVTVYHPDDDFGADTAQSFAADGEALWGWYAFNRAHATTIECNDYAAHILTMVTAAESVTWATGDYSGPYAFKKITGNFDVRVRAQVSFATAASVTAGMLLVRSQSDTTDWIGIQQRTHTDGNSYVYVRNCVDGTATDVYTGASTDTYLRIVRSGSTITCYSSADGVSWTQRDTRTRADLSDTVDIGCAMIATGADSAARVNFSGFAFEDSTAYSEECSANPAWVLYDLLTDTHYGIGAHIDTSQVNLDLFIAFADHCNTLVTDGAGGTHRRHRFDGVVDVQRGAWETINRIAENYRALIIKQADKIRIIWQAEAAAVQLFAMSNIKAGSFSQVYQSPEVAGNFWAVQFLAEDADWEQEYAPYPDPDIPAGEPYREATISAYGITRRAEAMRKARWHCRANRYLTRMVSFSTGLDAIACEPGDRIEIQHDVPQWGVGGRVVSADSTSVVLDKKVTLAAGQTYQVIVRHCVDDTMETRTVQDAAGEYLTLTVLPAWTLTPSADDVWALGITSIVTKPFIVTTIRRSGDLECEIEALEYVEGAYDDTIDTLDVITYTELSDPRTIPANVTELVVTERAQCEKDGVIKNVIDVTYALPTGAVGAQVYWREDGMTTWQYAGQTTGIHFTIDSGVVYGITYNVAVAPLSPWGLHRDPDACASASVTVQGKIAAPPDVTGLTVTRIGDQICLRWTAVACDDLAGYELRYGVSTWEAALVLVRNVKTTEYLTPNFAQGSCYYHVKAKNTSGIYSATANSVNVDIAGRIAENLVIERDEGTETWDGTPVDMTVDGVQLDLDSGHLTGTYETPELDCLAPVRSLVSCLVAGSQIDLSLTWADATFTWGSTTAQETTWSGTGTNHLTVAVQFRYGNTSGNLGTYQTFVPGQYSAQYFQFKVTVTVDSLSYSATLEQMVTRIDVPDYVIAGANIAIAATGTTTITWANYGPGFNVVPKVVVSPNAGAAGDNIEIVTRTATVMTVRYWNAAGTQVAGYCNFVAHGY